MSPSTCTSLLLACACWVAALPFARGGSQLRGTRKDATAGTPDESEWEHDFSGGVMPVAEQECQARLSAENASDTCPCEGGGATWGCCMDGGIAAGIDANGAGGGRLFDSATRWRWLERPGFDWTCSEEAQCGDKYANGATARGADIVFVPQGANCTSPRILMVHGDSWTGGSPNETGYFWHGSRLASMTGAVVMSIDYPLPPTCLDATCSRRADFKVVVDWVLRSAEYLATHVPAVDGAGLPPEGCETPPGQGPPLLIAGDSSGAGSSYSALVALSSKADSLNGGKDKFVGGVLFSGWYDLQCTSPTYVSNAFADIPRVHPTQWGSNSWPAGDISYADPPAGNAWKSTLLAVNYAGSYEATFDRLASTAHAGPEMLRSLPPLYMTVGGAEVLMGENYVVAQNAAAASTADHTNEVVLDVFNGMWHDFEMYSQGCANRAGVPLWQGQLAWARMARFVRDVAATGHAPCASHMPKGAPLTTWHMTKPLVPPGAEGHDWAPEGARDDGFGCPPAAGPA